MRTIYGCLAFVVCMLPLAAMAEAPARDHIVTHAKRFSSGLGSFRDFSTTGTPCRVVGNGTEQRDLRHLRALFAEAGMNVVKGTKDNVPCRIVVQGYVTTPNGEGKPVTPANAEFLLANQELVVDVVGPAIQLAEGAEQVAENASGMTGALSAGDRANAIQAGHAIGSHSGAGGATGVVVGMLAAVVADVVVGVSARNNTPAGVASIRAVLTTKDGFLPPVQGFDIYAASTRPETSVDLLRAAVARFVAEIAKVEAEAKASAQ